MKETDFNKKVQLLWESHGGYIIKIEVANKAGVHDMLASMPNNKGIGRFCSLEGKLAYNKMSQLQIAHRNKVITSGGLAKEVKTLNDVLLVIQWVKEDYIQKISNEKTQLKQFTL